MTTTAPLTTFAGVGSSFDVQSVIDGLVNAEKAPEAAMQTSQTNLQSQMSLLSSIASNLNAFNQAAQALNSQSAIQSLTATSSNSGVLTASAASYATPASYNLTVQSLAQAQTSMSVGFTGSGAGAAGSGTMTISVGGRTPPYSIDYGSNDTLASIAASINSQAGGEVNASVVYDGGSYHLVVTSNGTGTANALSFGGSGPLATMTTAQPATDAQFTVNGVSMTRSSNTVSDAINGVTFNLQGTSSAKTTITVGADTSQLTQKIQALVTAYNTVQSQVSGQLSYNGTTQGEDTLFGDSTIQGLEQQLGDVFANIYSSTSGGSYSPADLGMTLQDDGTIALDTTKLQQTLTADPNAAQTLLLGNSTNGSDGLVGAINSMVNQYTAYGTGALMTAQASKQTQYDSYTTQIANIEAQAQTLSDHLRAQFAQLDATMSTLTNQQSFIQNMFFKSSSSS